MESNTSLPPASYIVKKQYQTSVEEREAYLKDVGYNMFNLPSRAVTIDLLTDSGTCALPQSCLSALLSSDEAYSRHNWYYAFLDAFRDLCERGSKPKKNYLKLFDSNLCHEEYRETFVSNKDREPSMINYD